MTEDAYDRAHRADKYFRDAEKDLQFEAGKVEFLLQTMNLARHRAELLKRTRGHGRDWLLTFADFNEMFPTFPLLLYADRLAGVSLHLDKRCFWPALFSRFQDAPFVPPYEVWYER